MRLKLQRLFTTPYNSSKFTRKKNVYFLVLFIPILAVFLIASLHYAYNLPTVPWTAIKWQDEEFVEDPTEIVILRWTRFFKSYTVFKSPDVFRVGDKCRNPNNVAQRMTANCRITYDRRYFKRSDAVVFHLWDLVEGAGVGEEMPPNHPPEQIWIYQNLESPDVLNLGHRSYLKGFNWTMTYRRDSDFCDPYGWLFPLTPEETTNFDSDSLRQLSSKKTKLAAWIVSGCDTFGKREVFVKELRKYVPVDIFGKCGTHVCHREYGECYAEVAEEYKFYLAFENTLCVDYVTEKFFNALQNNIVPVVYGGANYSRIAPQGSYINARDFKSPKNLAEYLKYLDENLEEYLKYFQWKSEYKANRNEEGKWCGLCQKIQELRKENKGTLNRKWYEDVQDWWHSQIVAGESVPACAKPDFLSFS